ncbi:MAG: glycosyl hydrolase, partial [Armatimonadota bacterium]
MPQNQPDSLIKRLFTKPSSEYTPVPWWAWAGTLEPELLEQQLRQMRAQGLTEFFIFPIYGMDVEFMSPEYIDRIRRVIGWCKELGMRLWIYDELNWPSGVAAGLVPRKHPEAVASQVHIERYEKLPPEQLRSLLGDESVMSVVQVLQDGSVRPIDNRAVPASSALDVLAFRRKRDQIASLPVRGCLWTRNDPGLLDILSASAVRAFIEEAYEPIARAFPEELGRTIRGFFTDEPQFAPGALPWTDGLPKEFRKRYGYDILPHLHRLIFDDPDCDRVRIDYWSLIADMASSNYTGQLADWCAEHNMALTGHMVQEENSYSVWWNGDVPSHLLKMQVPGCDLLTLATNYKEPEEWYVFGGKSLIKSAKNPGSAARYTGAKRVLCEAYGVLPWWKAPEHEKDLTDWLVALGVNLINDNSLITDICDFRKRAISGKHFTQPYWPDEHIYYEYAARICGLTAETTLDTQLLVLYPSTTWFAGVRGGTDTSEALRELELAFDVTCDALLRRHWHYEHLYEQILETASVKGGALVTPGGEFRGIVLAGINRLRPQHAAKLEQFAHSGGTIILASSDVTVVEQDHKRPLRAAAAARLDCKSPTFYDDLDRALAERIVRPWRISGPGAAGVISAARIDRQGVRYLFLANMTPGPGELEI